MTRKAKNKTHKSRAHDRLKGGWGESYHDRLKLKGHTRAQGKVDINDFR